MTREREEIRETGQIEARQDRDWKGIEELSESCLRDKKSGEGNRKVEKAQHDSRNIVHLFEYMIILLVSKSINPYTSNL